MPSFWAHPSGSPHNQRLHPVLTSTYDEICATLARLFVYVGALALLGILALHAWDQLPELEAAKSVGKSGWTTSIGAYAAFNTTLSEQDKSRTYAVLTHPDGGRKDIFRWPAQAREPLTELEIYRPGSENDVLPGSAADLADRMPVDGSADLETAGVIESRLGPVALVRRAGSGDSACLGFLRRIDDPPLLLSGWSCQGNSLPARRMMIGCMLDRLTVLGSETDPKLAELFGRTDRRRGGCTDTVPTGPSADWITGTDNARLRGSL